MDGIALTGETLKQAPHMPNMVKTGFVDEYSEREAIDAGAREFITKPFALAELSARFHKMMRDHAALMELKDEERRKRGELVTALQRESDEKIEDLKKKGRRAILAVLQYNSSCARRLVRRRTSRMRLSVAPGPGEETSCPVRSTTDSAAVTVSGQS